MKKWQQKGQKGSNNGSNPHWNDFKKDSRNPLNNLECATNSKKLKNEFITPNPYLRRKIKPNKAIKYCKKQKATNELWHFRFEKKRKWTSQIYPKEHE